MDEQRLSFHDLAESLRRQKKDAEVAAVKKRFADIWAVADVTPQSSCFCVTP